MCTGLTNGLAPKTLIIPFPFSIIAGKQYFTSAYKAADVFTINDLNEICAQSATAHIQKGGDVFTWRNYLGQKYSDLPGVCKLHDFLVVKTNIGEVVMKVREWCFSGEWKRSPLRNVNDDVSPTLLSTYSETHVNDIPEGKMTDMVTMYNRFIPLDRRLGYLPPLAPTTSNCSTAVHATNATALGKESSTASSQSHLQSGTSLSKRARKQSKCSVEG